MPISTPLRKTFRSISTFQLLPKRELDAVVECMICQEYKPNDKIWSVGTRLDFIGIIQTGEIIVEYRTSGAVKHSVRLVAGTFFQPPDVGVEDNVLSVSVYAATEVTLYTLHLRQLVALRSKCPTLDAVLPPRPYSRIRRLSWTRLWATTVAMLIVLFVWHDVAGILSGIFYLASDQWLPTTNHQRTLRLLDYAAWLNPQASHAHNKKGYIWSRMGKEQRATSAFDQALSVDDSSGPALNNLAATYFISGLVNRAAALQQRAVQANQNTAIARYNLGLVLMAQNDNLEATRAFKEATRIESDWALPYIHLSSIYLQMRDYAKAEQAARIATRLDPAQQSAHLSLALALYNQGERRDALSAIEHALEIRPEDVVSKFYQALILRDLGDHSQALLILQQLFDSSTDPQQRVRILMEIEGILRLATNPSKNQ